MTVEALRRRRPETLADLLAAHGRELQAVAYLILRDRSEAEDVVIEIFLTAFERGGADSFGAWYNFRLEVAESSPYWVPGSSIRTRAAGHDGRPVRLALVDPRLGLAVIPSRGPIGVDSV